ncbi:E3 ubiquitin-protein ligase NRDP1 [Eumeta japonica]|uniref:E3 ubiquitin-protein ligase NRDP1 n=1 Tax=Eumeta variegata TaxID=151549 RepID=A0A4C2A8R0_EUMVA|nr:E3 ubiquitin-protein ligase NRDP1 [Eumeta japonica]
MRAIADQMERDEVIRWSSTLARARVTRWGGMISTPDDALQASMPGIVVWRALPYNVDLVQSQTVMAGKQAVLVLSCDNAHMSEDVMVEPGLVMIFAHGIE